MVDFSPIKLSVLQLKRYINSAEFKLPKGAAHPISKIAKVRESKLNYLTLMPIDKNKELYLLAAPMRKRLETRFMIGGPAQNNYYSIEDYIGKPFVSSYQDFRPVRKRLVALVPDANFKVNSAKGYVITDDLSIFIAVYKKTRWPQQTDEQIEKYLVELYNESNNMYHQGTSESTLSDSSFDKLRIYLIDKGLVDSTKTGANPVAASKKVTLKTQLGSLENAFNQDELKNWFKKYSPNDYYIQTPKIDGISAQANYVKGKLVGGNTKGDGYVGEDITSLLKVIPEVPKQLKRPIDIELRLEIFMRDSIFNKKYGPASNRVKKFKTSRNMVAGQKNRKTPDVEIAKDLSVLAYSILNSKDNKDVQLDKIKALGFPVVQYSKLPLKKLDSTYKEFNQYKRDNDYLMDGTVVELNDNNLRTDYVAGKINPRFAVAFKPDSQEVEAVISSISYKVSKDRIIVPGAIFKTPVNIGGVEVRAANLHNYAKVREMGLGPNAVVIVQRSGDAIPHVKSVVKRVKPQYPEALDWEWNATNINLILRGSAVSYSQEIEKIKTFFSALKVERFAGGLIESFYTSGFKTIPDILNMTKEQIIKEVPRQGDTSAQNIITEFAKLKNPGVRLPDLMYASGCFGRGLGQGKLDGLYNEYGDELVSGWSGTRLDDIAASIGDLAGFSYETGKQFAQGIKPYIAFHRSIKSVIYIKSKQTPKKGKLTGQTISVTSFRDKQLGLRIEELGGVYAENMTSNTTILLVPSKTTTSSKVTRAQRKNIKIMTRDEFEKLIK